jgi:hypothetical protein
MARTSKRVTQILLFFAWAPVAYATTVTLNDTLSGVPPMAWAMVLVLSTISGLAALLNHLKEDTPERMLFFVLSRMIGSILSGVLTFFVLSGMGGVNDFFSVAIISIAAYAGVQLLDSAASGLATRVKRFDRRDIDDITR